MCPKLSLSIRYGHTVLKASYSNTKSFVFFCVGIRLTTAKNMFAFPRTIINEDPTAHLSYTK